MTQQDKYGIRTQIDQTLKSHAMNHLLTVRPDKVVSSIWEEVYINMPVCDPEDSSPLRVIEILNERCGEGFKSHKAISCMLEDIESMLIKNYPKK